MTNEIPPWEDAEKVEGLARLYYERPGWSFDDISEEDQEMWREKARYEMRAKYLEDHAEPTE